NPAELKPALATLRECFTLGAPRIVVIGGDDIPLDPDGYDWQRVVLTPELTRDVQENFERFLESPEWFRKNRLAYRRAYLLHGPPGNGKTSIVRIMASHPAISAYSLNFSAAEYGDRELSEIFRKAARTCPALVIIEDVDRLFGRDGVADRLEQQADNRTEITLP